MRGTLTISFVLAGDAGMASRGVVQLALRPDWGWSVDIRVDSVNPTRFCFGCMGSKTIPLAERYRRSVKDSVWVTWGGNSFKHPVVY